MVHTSTSLPPLFLPLPIYFLVLLVQSSSLPPPFNPLGRPGKRSKLPIESSRRPTIKRILVHFEVKARKKYVGAECRHEMRPSSRLPNVSGADSRLGLTMG